MLKRLRTFYCCWTVFVILLQTAYVSGGELETIWHYGCGFNNRFHVHSWLLRIKNLASCDCGMISCLQNQRNVAALWHGQYSHHVLAEMFNYFSVLLLDFNFNGLSLVYLLLAICCLA